VNGRRKSMNEKNAFFSFIAFLLSSSVIQFILLLKLTDHMFPVKLVIGSQVSSFSRGKSHHPVRNSGPFFVIRLSFTSRTKNSVWLLFGFPKGVPAGQVWPVTTQSQISHPYPGSSWPFFLLHPPPHSLSLAWAWSTFLRLKNK
jgi:hypothetical protein